MDWGPGLPLTGAYFDERYGMVVQWFERARFELREEGVITMGHVGLEALDNRR